MSDNEELLDIAQAARFLNVSETSLRRWTNSGRLACLRVGQRRERRFRRADLFAFLQAEPVQKAEAGRRVADQLPIPSGSHLCGLYGSTGGAAQLACEFLRPSLSAGFISFLIGEPDMRASVLAELEATAPGVSTAIAAGRLLQSNYEQTAAAQMRYLSREMLRATQAGAHGFRVVGIVDSVFQQLPPHTLQRHEREYDELISSQFPVVSLCLFDARAFSGVELLEILRSHPDIFKHGVQQALA